MPFRFGPMELIIVLVVVLIIFGVGRLPEIGGAMGKAIKEFRSSQDKSVDEQLAQSEKEK
ncbi:MAG: twin-arginine translocase TatA/TatE family subunit [SAR202 cluster bacterium]|nr:twin-arginine translocase TatA/TatE family subunit [SAR202 cluster bacterium]|tara:strand:+ start:197 stop:376 length:180 start_codon:yes stop_codon:yes gene_type:complete